MKYFAEENVNSGRQPEVDFLKAICIVGMIFLHVFEDCGTRNPMEQLSSAVKATQLFKSQFEKR